MLTTLIRTLSLLAVLSIAGAIPGFAANNTLGSYRLNIAKSSYTPAPNPVKDLTVTRERSTDGLTQTTNGTLAGDVPFHATYTTRGNGAEVPVAGNPPFDTIAVKQVNANTITDERQKLGSRYRASGTTIFTAGGKAMIVTIRGISDDSLELAEALIAKRTALRELQSPISTSSRIATKSRSKNSSTLS
jgi:hypothetical protein